jgi:hypothetical protein
MTLSQEQQKTWHMGMSVKQTIANLAIVPKTIHSLYPILAFCSSLTTKLGEILFLLPRES